jgi:hypothetical protein
MKTTSQTTSNIVERLRKAAANSRLHRGDEDRMLEAADEIERLTGLFDKWHTIAAEQREEIKQLKEEKGSGCKA